MLTGRVKGRMRSKSPIFCLRDSSRLAEKYELFLFSRLNVSMYGDWAYLTSPDTPWGWEQGWEWGWGTGIESIWMKRIEVQGEDGNEGFGRWRVE